MSVLTEEIRWTLHQLATRSGQRCEWCGKPITRGQQSSMHHRMPRGAGGTSRANAHSLAVLVLVHGHGTLGCHRDIEINRDAARARGFLISQHGRDDDGTPVDPASVPIVLVSGRRVFLDPVSAPYLLPTDGVLYVM